MSAATCTPSSSCSSRTSASSYDGMEWFDVDDLPAPAHVPVRTAMLDAIRGTGAPGERGDEFRPTSRSFPA